jgi:hypothetical protein
VKKNNRALAVLQVALWVWIRLAVVFVAVVSFAAFITGISNAFYASAFYG